MHLQTSTTGPDRMRPLGTPVVPPPTVTSPIAMRIQLLARERWRGAHDTVVVGSAPPLMEALARVARFATADGPVLLTGETGTGKELFARALYLLSSRTNRPFLSVNCAQYHDGHLLASELFGHRKGSFTGAVTDHRGVFEEAEGGFVFLDEIGELSVKAQAMLLRTLSEREIVPVGATHARAVNVRVVAATSRDLRPMIEDGAFRADLYFRLRHLAVRVPSLRERGDDWRLVLDHYLAQLVHEASSCKRFSSHALATLDRYQWPGNVRELRSLVATGYWMSDGPTIEAEHFGEALESVARDEQLRRVPLSTSELPHGRAADAPPDRARPSDGAAHEIYAQLTGGQGGFWDLVYRPFMDRDLSRTEARCVVERGLIATRGSYKRLLAVFGVADVDYLKFMDFLRHHQLKPGD